MPEFDEFYLTTRRDLLLQTFALTGDLTASRAAVHDAFVLSHHHWRKVARLDDAIGWVRPRAWRIAQRRHVGRIWHRVKGATEAQKETLKALSQIPETQRKLVILTQLTQTPPSKVAREVGLTQARCADELEQGTAALSRALTCEPVELGRRLHELDPLVAEHGLPRATAIRRQGQMRRRRHVALGAAAAVASTALAGWFVHDDGRVDGALTADASTASSERPVKAAQMLDAVTTRAALASDRGPHDWKVVSTHDNTRGDGINLVCQARRFADPQGETTWVRRLQTGEQPRRQITQTVEVSTTPGATVQAFRTAAGWYSGCTTPGVQLGRAYDIEGVGDDAKAYRLRLPGNDRGSYFVLLARKGTTLTTIGLRNRQGLDQPVQGAARLLGVAVDRLCNTDAVPTCSLSQPRVEPVLLPRSGEGVGMLATADLPRISGLPQGWVGTKVTRTRSTPTRTLCDASDFAKAGATRLVTRTFLVPRAKLPPRFGLSQTTASFASAKDARRMFDQVRSRMASCPDRQLGSEVPNSVERLDGFRGSSLALWRIRTELSDDRAPVHYWMGVAVVGRHLTQINFAPTARRDLGEGAFTDLLARSRDRLFELRP